MTPLDTAHAAMQAAPQDDTARLQFYERLADAEVFILLEEEARDNRIIPRVFATDEGDFVLIFDLEERMAEFVGAPAPYAALSGRALINMLQGQSLGIGVNLEVAPSAYLMGPEAVDWLASILARRPEEARAKPVEIAAPGVLPELLLTSLDAKLSLMGAAARQAYLALVTYEDDSRGHMLAFVDVAPGAEAALSQAASEALTFSGVDAGQLDVAFFAANDPMSARLARVGLGIDLPQPPEPEVNAGQNPGQNPGMNPSKPPKLR